MLKDVPQNVAEVVTDFFGQLSPNVNFPITPTLIDEFCSDLLMKRSRYREQVKTNVSIEDKEFKTAYEVVKSVIETIICSKCDSTDQRIVRTVANRMFSEYNKPLYEEDLTGKGEYGLRDANT